MKYLLLLFILFFTIKMPAQQRELTPAVLVACDTPYFDFGHRDNTTSVTFHWKVRNISKVPVMLPVFINVYVDVPIGNRWGKEEYLLPGKSVDVIFNVPYAFGRTNFHKEGWIEVYSNDKIQKIPARISGHFDNPTNSIGKTDKSIMRIK